MTDIIDGLGRKIPDSAFENEPSARYVELMSPEVRAHYEWLTSLRSAGIASNKPLMYENATPACPSGGERQITAGFEPVLCDLAAAPREIP